MDGYQIAEYLRANAETRMIRLIACTGYGQDADRQRAMDAGFDAHLVKPVDTDILLSSIAELTSKPPRGDTTV
jgi:CheY-like chemotaxis protein